MDPDRDLLTVKPHEPHNFTAQVELNSSIGISRRRDQTNVLYPLSGPESWEKVHNRGATALRCLFPLVVGLGDPGRDCPETCTVVEEIVLWAKSILHIRLWKLCTSHNASRGNGGTCRVLGGRGGGFALGTRLLHLRLHGKSHFVQSFKRKRVTQLASEEG